MTIPTPRLLLGLLLLASAQGSAAARAQTAAELTPVNPREPPFAAIGRINNSAYGRCSAVLLAPRRAVTAAHCLYNARAGRFLQPASIHVLFGFDRGAYGFHARVSDIALAQGYDPAQPSASAPHDLAVLTLAEAVPADFPPIAPAENTPETAPESGSSETASATLVTAGFAQERSEVMTVSRPCAIRGRTANGLIVAGCSASHGFSGGPLLDRATGRLVGMSIATATVAGAPAVLAIPAERLVGPRP